MKKLITLLVIFGYVITVGVVFAQGGGREPTKRSPRFGAGAGFIRRSSADFGSGPLHQLRNFLAGRKSSQQSPQRQRPTQSPTFPGSYSPEGFYSPSGVMPGWINPGLPALVEWSMKSDLADSGGGFGRESGESVLSYLKRITTLKPKTAPCKPAVPGGANSGGGGRCAWNGDLVCVCYGTGGDTGGGCFLPNNGDCRSECPPGFTCVQSNACR